MSGLEFILSSILLGVGLAMDAFSVSLANGLSEPDMKKKRMILMAGVYAFFQFSMPVIGWILVHSIIEVFNGLQKFIPWIALVILVLIGGKMILESLLHKSDEEDESLHISKGGVIIQGIATSIDALSAGLTFSDHNVFMALLASGIIGLITFIICMTGLLIGKKVGMSLSKGAAVLGGCILIVIGIKMIL